MSLKKVLILLRMKMSFGYLCTVKLRDDNIVFRVEVGENFLKAGWSCSSSVKIHDFNRRCTRCTSDVMWWWRCIWCDDVMIKIYMISFDKSNYCTFLTSKFNFNRLPVLSFDIQQSPKTKAWPLWTNYRAFTHRVKWVVLYSSRFLDCVSNVF